MIGTHPDIHSKPHLKLVAQGRCGGSGEHRRGSTFSGNGPRMKIRDNRGEKVISHLGPEDGTEIYEDGIEIYPSAKWKSRNNLRKYRST